jgi:hypothetical protein
MMVNVMDLMVIRYMPPRHYILHIILHRVSKRPNRVVWPVHHGKCASGSAAEVQVTVP